MKKLMEYYEAHEKIKAAYDAADKADNEEDREAARADIKTWEDRIAKEGSNFIRVYRMFESAKERGNELIDIDEVVWDSDLESLLDELHRNGITRFTFSSTWSGAIETAWKFTEAGWRMTGLTQINGRCTAYMSNEYEKVPTYVFECRRA